MDDAEPKLYRLGDAARLLSISRSQAYVLAKRGEIPVIYVGDAMRVPRVALERLIDRQLAATTAER